MRGRDASCRTRRRFPASEPRMAALDPVEFCDPREDGVRHRRAGLRRRLDDLSPPVAPAERQRQGRAALALGPRQPAIAAVAIDLQDALEAVEETLGMLATAPRRIVEGDTRRIAPRSTIDRRAQAPRGSRSSCGHAPGREPGPWSRP